MKGLEIVLKSLYVDLDRIVALYKDNSMYFDRKDLRLLWNKLLSYAAMDIEAQQKKTQAASKNLRKPQIRMK